MKAMKDYHNLYLKWDVLILADVFENFRNNSSNNYELLLMNNYELFEYPRFK